MDAAESASIRQRGERCPASQHVAGAVATVLLGVGDWFVRFEFAKQRGMIHFHSLWWIADLYELVKGIMTAGNGEARPGETDEDAQQRQLHALVKWAAGEDEELHVGARHGGHRKRLQP